MERDGPRGVIVFNNPARRNAVKFAMWQGLPARLQELAEDPAVRVIVLRGAGDEAFVAGADISEFEEYRSSYEKALPYNEATGRAFAALRTCPKPTVAMIRGFCFGGGCAIALCCDLRVAAADARFSIPAAKLGIGYGRENVTQIVNTLGPATAREMLLTARVYDAEESLRKGLVHQVTPVEELEAFTRSYTEALATNAPLSLRAIKLAVNAALGPDSAAENQVVDEAMRICFDSEDYREGYRAFLEKRPTDFQGR